MLRLLTVLKWQPATLLLYSLSHSSVVSHILETIWMCW